MMQFIILVENISFIYYLDAKPGINKKQNAGEHQA